MLEFFFRFGEREEKRRKKTPRERERYGKNVPHFRAFQSNNVCVLFFFRVKNTQSGKRKPAFFYVGEWRGEKKKKPVEVARSTISLFRKNDSLVFFSISTSFSSTP